MPQDIKKARLTIFYYILITLLMMVVLPLFAIYGKYSGVAMLSIPFGIGVLLAFISSLNERKKLKEILPASLVPIVLSILSLIVFAREGAICLIIFGALLLIPYYLGIVAGFMIQKNVWAKHTTLLLVFATMAVSFVSNPSFNQGQTIQDEIIIKAPAEKVWTAITKEFHFGASENFFFSNGVSYPKKMAVVQDETGRHLQCQYNNGMVNAPISSYEEHKSFTFHFNDSIITMREKNLYKEAHTMHIQNHFIVNYGKFEIVPIDEHSCKLISTSNFMHKFEPEAYTNYWVTYFLSKIHMHVLSAIKEQTEAA